MNKNKSIMEALEGLLWPNMPSTNRAIIQSAIGALKDKPVFDMNELLRYSVFYSDLFMKVNYTVDSRGILLERNEVVAYLSELGFEVKNI